MGTVADPGFPRVGHQFQGVCGRRGFQQTIIWPNIPENCTKIKKIWPKVGRVRNLSMQSRHWGNIVSFRILFHAPALGIEFDGSVGKCEEVFTRDEIQPVTDIRPVIALCQW